MQKRLSEMQKNLWKMLWCGGRVGLAARHAKNLCLEPNGNKIVKQSNSKWSGRLVKMVVRHSGFATRDAKTTGRPVKMVVRHSGSLPEMQNCGPTGENGGSTFRFRYPRCKNCGPTGENGGSTFRFRYPRCKNGGPTGENGGSTFRFATRDAKTAGRPVKMVVRHSGFATRDAKTSA